MGRKQEITEILERDERDWWDRWEDWRGSGEFGRLNRLSRDTRHEGWILGILDRLGREELGREKGGLKITDKEMQKTSDIGGVKISSRAITERSNKIVQ